METSASSAGSNLGDESEGAGFPGSELDLAGRSRMANLRTTMFGASAEPARVDRFVVLETIGAGGMGVVHAAYDPRLDRKVALKLVKPEAAAANGSGEARLLREAQAMARLSHPNVVQIHEVGAWDGRVFIAMELVPGRSLAAWLEEQPRAWREVVRMFVDAGRGLAAAHAAGIVHRDFKPENVLVGDDGRVRVTDFGLARGGEGVSAAGERWRESGGPLAEIVAGTSTGTAAFAGTPRFMSPEQFLGEPATAASDQFSFCVALHLALHGVHPFAGDDRETLARAVIAGERREPPRVRIPRKLHKALVRGLSRAPERRSPGMDELLQEIEPRASWSRVAPAALFVVTGAGAVGMVYESDPCEDTSGLLAGVWDAERRAEIHEVFAASAVPDADRLWSVVAGEFDHFVGVVADSYVRSCKAQRGDERRTQGVHGLRVGCLGRRLNVVRGVVDELQTGSPSALRNAPLAAAKLESLGDCEDERTLLLGMEPPPLRDLSALSWVKERIDEARSHELLGDMRASRAQADIALMEARDVGYEPVIAEALYQRGRLDNLERDFVGSEAALREALQLAIGSRHDALVGEVWSWLVPTVALARGEAREVDEWLPQAEAWLRRGAGSARLRAGLERARATVFQIQGDFVRAEAATRRAVELRASVLGADDLQVMLDRLNHASQLDSLGQTADAIAAIQVLLVEMEDKVGAAHGLFADVLYNFAVALLKSTDREALAEAEAVLRRAEAIIVATRGPTALSLAENYVSLAQVAQRRGDIAQAERRLAAALEIYERYPGHPDRALVSLSRGALLFEEGRLDEALATYVEAREIGLAAWGDQCDVVRLADNNLGDVLRAKGDFAQAIRRYAASIRAIEAVLGTQSAELIDPLFGLGRAQDAVGSPCEAVKALDRARGLMTGEHGAAVELAEVELGRGEADARCKMTVVD